MKRENFLIDIFLIVEGLGQDRPWSKKPTDCSPCQKDKKLHCGEEICVASTQNNTSLAKTYPSVCDFLTKFYDSTQTVLLYIGLGPCNSLFSPTGTFTLFFDTGTL